MADFNHEFGESPLLHHAASACMNDSPRIRILVLVFLSPPVGLGRGAQPKVDQGERLSEPKASSSSTPL
ncbi:MAG: hypothetical protein Q7J71_00915, partial [Polaromonas sp.]|nr:hypothetical protein [Polaromonas sp.]